MKALEKTFKNMYYKSMRLFIITGIAYLRTISKYFIEFNKAIFSWWSEPCGLTMRVYRLFSYLIYPKALEHLHERLKSTRITYAPTAFCSIVRKSSIVIDPPVENKRSKYTYIVYNLCEDVFAWFLKQILIEGKVLMTWI